VEVKPERARLLRDEGAGKCHRDLLLGARPPGNGEYRVTRQRIIGPPVEEDDLSTTIRRAGRGSGEGEGATTRGGRLGELKTDDAGLRAYLLATCALGRTSTLTTTEPRSLAGMPVVKRIGARRIIRLSSPEATPRRSRPLRLRHFPSQRDG